MIELHACKQRSNRSNVTQCIGMGENKAIKLL